MYIQINSKFILLSYMNLLFKNYYICKKLINLFLFHLGWECLNSLKPLNLRESVF